MSDAAAQAQAPTWQERKEFLQTVWYESRRAGLDTGLVLGLIQVESAFRKFAVCPVGARGYMQVMPFWTRVIGDGDASKLFHMQTNLRFGCVILRHYLDRERGDLFMALGRYNGSRGKPQYPNAVFAAGRNWDFHDPPPAWSRRRTPRNRPRECRAVRTSPSAGSGLVLWRPQHLLQLAALVHLHHDVRAADELAVHVELGDGRPVAVFLDALADLASSSTLTVVKSSVSTPQALRIWMARPEKPHCGKSGVALHVQHHVVFLTSWSMRCWCRSCAKSP